MPAISIITATLNSAEHLPALASSLEKQTCTDFEWLVVDGGSADETPAIVRQSPVREKLLICEPDRGIYDALNKGIRHSSAAYYLVVGADDVLYPDAIKIYVEAIKAHAADLITAPVAAGKRVVRPTPWLGRFLSGPPKVSAHSVGTAIKKALHATHGDYRLDYPIAADTLFLRRVVRTPKTQIVYLTEVVGRFGMAGLSSRNRLRTLTDSFAANVEAGEPLVLQWLLFSLRLLKNLSRIRTDRSHR